MPIEGENTTNHLTPQEIETIKTALYFYELRLRAGGHQGYAKEVEELRTRLASFQGKPIRLTPIGESGGSELDTALQITRDDLEQALLPVTQYEETESEVVERYERRMKLTWERLYALHDAMLSGRAITLENPLWHPTPAEGER